MAFHHVEVLTSPSNLQRRQVALCFHDTDGTYVCYNLTSMEAFRLGKQIADVLATMYQKPDIDGGDNYQYLKP